MTTTAPTASTREAYGRTLLDLGAANQNIVVLGGDLNVSTFVHLFRDTYPERFFDFGPAEQNIMSVAAGLASSGKTPFVSTFAVFGTGRPLRPDKGWNCPASPQRQDSLHPFGDHHRRRRHVGPQH